jgi:hypothetical protein
MHYKVQTQCQANIILKFKIFLNSQRLNRTLT